MILLACFIQEANQHSRFEIKVAFLFDYIFSDKGQVDIFCALAETHSYHLQNTLTYDLVQRKLNTLLNELQSYL